MLKNRTSLLAEFLKNMITIYLVITISVVTLLSTIEFFTTKKNYLDEMNKILNTSQGSLALFIYNLQEEGIDSIVTSIDRSQIISEIILLDESKEVLRKKMKKDIPKGKFFWNKTFSISKDIFHSEEDGAVKRILGTLTLYSSHSLIFQKLWFRFFEILLFSLFSMGLIILLIYRSVKDNFIQPLQTFSKKVEEIDLTDLRPIEIELKKTNEFSALKEAFNQVLVDLKSSQKEAEQSSNNMQKKAAELESYQKDLRIMVEKRTNTLKEIIGSISTGYDLAKSGKTTVGNGRSLMNQIVTVLNEFSEIKTQLDSILLVIKEIDKKASNINKIVSESKLLSFNAEIEAAHAGKFGAGFTVVAEEMGVLAENSGKFAQEISGILRSSTEEVQNILDSTQKVITEGLSTAEEAGDNFLSIENNFSEIFQQLSNIEQSSKAISFDKD